MSVLITGAGSALGQALARRCGERGLEHRLLSRAEMDSTRASALDAALAARCLALADQPETITAHTRFHWWSEAA